jgi:acyl-CoA reductase-like NAD-dependent aldehyde dehydrogenase
MQYGKVKDYFADCHANGYKFALGGKIDENAKGWFVPVSLVDNPPENSRIVQEEPFGPILPLLKWSDEDDVIARANDTIYGLGASVWGKDLEAVERIGCQLEAGTVWVNTHDLVDSCTPFGGFKQSGFGRDKSIHALEKYTDLKTTWITL